MSDTIQLQDEEAEEENSYLERVVESSPLKLGLVHSSTTDTLDSVYLDPPGSDQETETSPTPQTEADDIADTVEKESKNETSDIDVEIEAEIGKDDNISFKVGKASDNVPPTSPPSLSKYFGTNQSEDDPFAGDFFDNIPGIDENKQASVEVTEEAQDKDVVNIETNLPDDAELPVNETKNTADMTGYNKDTVNSNNNHRSLEISNVESIDFELEVNQEEQVETPVDIEGKDQFESFTADLADLETMDALGMSPAAPSYMTERNIQDYFRQASQADSFTRQISQNSAISASSQEHNSVQPDIGTEIEEQLQDLTVESIGDVENVNKEDTKVEKLPESQIEHQPIFPPFTTLSPVDSPVHQPSFKSTTSTMTGIYIEDNQLVI